MPELPEVETVVAGLRREAVGRWIESVEILRDQHLHPSGAALAEGLTGRLLTDARRWGKIWMLDTDDGQTVVGHLRMSGQLRVHPLDEPRRDHVHLVATLSDGHELRWRDVRRFGWMHLVPTAEALDLPVFANLGPDALAMTEDEFVAALRGSRRGLKALLLGQDVIAGLGNIYVDEALFRSRLHPRLAGGRLGLARARRLYGEIRAVLDEAIAARGTSISQSYRGVDGRRGAYQEQLQIYGRGGQACLVCGRELLSAQVAGRTTVWCPGCQPRR